MYNKTLMYYNFKTKSFRLCKKKCWLSGLDVPKCLSEKEPGKTVQTASFDLGLPCLSMPFWKATIF